MKSTPSLQAAVTSLGVNAPGMVTIFALLASSTMLRSSPGLVKKCAPASKQRRAVTGSKTVPAPTIMSGTLVTMSWINSHASGTVMVISTMGIPPAETAAAANLASSVEDTRIAGTMPISSILSRTSSLFIEPLPVDKASEETLSHSVSRLGRFYLNWCFIVWHPGHIRSRDRLLRP